MIQDRKSWQRRRAVAFNVVVGRKSEMLWTGNQVRKFMLKNEEVYIFSYTFFKTIKKI